MSRGPTNGDQVKHPQGEKAPVDQATDHRRGRNAATNEDPHAPHLPGPGHDATT